jgi:hypothetical protein
MRGEELALVLKRLTTKVDARLPLKKASIVAMSGCGDIDVKGEFLGLPRTAYEDPGPALATWQPVLANTLWHRRQPVAGTRAAVYLREMCGFKTAAPAAFGFLPATPEYGAAIIAAFGPDGESVSGVCVTPLGGGLSSDFDARSAFIGTCTGSPIVVAPAKGPDLAITETIEEACALAASEGAGLGVWAAGCAELMPALAPAVPANVESVSIFSRPDRVSARCAGELEDSLKSCHRAETYNLSFRGYMTIAAERRAAARAVGAAHR